MHAMQGTFLVMFWYFVRDPAEYRGEVVHSFSIFIQVSSLLLKLQQSFHFS